MKALQGLGLSERQGCRLVGCPRRTAQYRSKRPRDADIRQRLREHAHARTRFGWRRLKILLKRDGIVMNDKRLRRLYREEHLQVRPRKKRRVRLVRGNSAPPPTNLNEEWGLDFMEERLFATRRKVRALTIEDRLSREGLALDIDFSLTSRRVIRTLDEIAALRGYPRRLRVDNGPENSAGAMLTWSVEHDVALHFIDPGKPAQNAWIESFNSRVRDEFFNVQTFRTLPEMRAAASVWVADYNEVRPHSSLGYLTPKEFVEALTTAPTPQLSAA